MVCVQDLPYTRIVYIPVGTRCKLPRFDNLRIVPFVTCLASLNLRILTSSDYRSLILLLTPFHFQDLTDKVFVSIASSLTCQTGTSVLTGQAYKRRGTYTSLVLGLTTVQVGTDPSQIATGQDRIGLGYSPREVCTSVARGTLTPGLGSNGFVKIPSSSLSTLFSSSHPTFITRFFDASGPISDTGAV